MRRIARMIESLTGRAYFPHYLSFLIDNPLRRVLISPKTLVNRLAPEATAHILEIGAGSGFFSAEMARAIPRGDLQLFDLQPEMLRKARTKLAAAGLRNIGYTVGNAEQLPFSNAAFDAAILVAVLGEVPDRQNCLRSVFEVLMAGGIALFHEHLPDPDLIQLDELKSLTRTAGFDFVASWGVWWNYTAVFRKPAVA